MSSAGNLDCRFSWERIDDEHRIYDRQRGAGCFGENFIATAVDGVAAEMLCGLLNLAEATGGLRALTALVRR